MADARNTVWHQTDQINMSVQMATISLAGFAALPTLKINCNLTNIARGQCAGTIQPVEDHDGDGDGDGDGDSAKAASGQLLIFVDRPLMTAEINVSDSYFERLTHYMNRGNNRPMELILTLETELAVSIDGDLRIDEETIITINNISVNIPVK